MTPLIPLAAAFAALGLWLGLRLVRESRARNLARAGFFDAVKPLFDSAEVQLQPTGFPRMTGRSNGLAFDLQAVPDTLTFRKLPALWVMVSLPEPMPVGATLDVMARPSGLEPFSRFANLPQTLPRPSFLPETVVVRSDNAALVAPERLIARLAAIFANARIKEFVISPKGLRIVFLTEEADRGRYLIFRDAEMGMTPLSPSHVAPLLDTLGSMRQDLLDWSKEPG
jgi:hypothetical protein